MSDSKTAYDFPQNMFGRVYPSVFEIPPNAGGGMLGLMEFALTLAVKERARQEAGTLGFNYVVERADGKARLGSFNISGVMATQGTTRAGTELTRVLRDMGAVRYAVYSNIRPQSGSIPDIAIVGCEPGTTLGWMFDDAAVAKQGKRPLPKAIVPVESWFTGLLDQAASKSAEMINADSQNRLKEAVGEGGAALMGPAKEHMCKAAGDQAAKNALIFDGVWRGERGIFVLAFNDEIYEKGDGFVLSQPLLILGSSLLIADATHVMLVEESGQQAGKGGGIRIEERGAMFRVTGMSTGRKPKTAWFEALRSADGTRTVAMRGDRARGLWWTDPDPQQLGLAFVINGSMVQARAEREDDDDAEEDDVHGTSVAEAKMKRHGMVFTRYAAAKVEAAEVS